MNTEITFGVEPLFNAPYSRGGLLRHPTLQKIARELNAVIIQLNRGLLCIEHSARDMRDRLVRGMPYRVLNQNPRNRIF